MEGYTLKVGSRSILVEPTPLLATKANYRTHSLHWASDQHLVLSPSLVNRGLALAFILVGALLLLTAITIPFAGQEALGKAVIAACGSPIFLTIGMLSWPRRFAFDAATGQLRTSKLWWKWQRPLRDVLAVQLIEDPGTRPIGTTYQLNLVLDDERRPRVNLSNYTDQQATREVGREVARHLSIPLLE